MKAPDARWRCADCGGFVAAASVRLTAHGVPWGECSRCPTSRALVLFERVVATPHEHDERPVGVDASVLDFTEVATETFLSVIRRLPAGERFSVNTLRSRLDALEVPPVKRGRLFARAVELGLATPLIVEAGGVRVHAREPSTGDSANGATVRLYERTRPE